MIHSVAWPCGVEKSRIWSASATFLRISRIWTLRSLGLIRHSLKVGKTDGSGLVLGEKLGARLGLVLVEGREDGVLVGKKVGLFDGTIDGKTDGK